MEKVLGFQISEEWHYDTGKVWIGYLITVEPQEITEPNKCLECGKWFIKGEKVHPIREQYVYHEVEGHDVVAPYIGFLCQGCFEEAQSKGNFRGGKMRVESHKT